MTAFIKSEEQHYTLYSYVNSLNTELDALEERYQYLSKHYDQLRNLLDQEKSSNIAVASELNNQIQELNSEHQATLTAIENLKEEISSIQEPVEEMLKEFEECQFTLEFNKKLTKDEGFAVNEQNVEQYLGELEEYLSSLLTHLAYEKGAKVPMIAGVDERATGKMKDFIDSYLQSDNLIDEGDIEEIPLSVEEFQAKSKDIYAKRFGSTQ